MIKSFLVNYITSGPIVVAVVEGPDAIKAVRDISGNTEPKRASPGTIRGDFADDSYDKANKEKRSLYNIVHASTSVEEAEKIAEEIGYPVLLRPSYVLGGRAMELVHDVEGLKRYMQTAVQV